jgi:hypothetical protein
LFVPAKSDFGYANPFVADLLEGVLSPSVTLSASGVTSFGAFDLNSNKAQFIDVTVPVANVASSTFTDAIASYSYNFYLNGVSTKVATAEEFVIDAATPGTLDVVTSPAIEIQSGTASTFNNASGLYKAGDTANIDEILLEIGSGIWLPSLSIASYSGLSANSGLFSVPSPHTALEGAKFTRLSDTQLLITLSGTLTDTTLPVITIQPAAYRQTAANPAVRGYASDSDALAAEEFASSGLDNLIYVKLTNGVFANVINSGSFVFSGVTPNSTYIMNSGTFTRISDTEVVIVPGSGLDVAAQAAQALRLSGVAFVQQADTPSVTVQSSFVPNIGFSTFDEGDRADIIDSNDKITITLGAGAGDDLLFNPNITQSDITFSGLNAVVLSSANVRYVTPLIIEITGFTNLSAEDSEYEILLKKSAFIRGTSGSTRALVDSDIVITVS